MSGDATLGDFLIQLRQLRSMSPDLVERFFWRSPSIKGDELAVLEKVVEAMTPDERRITELLDPKRGPARRLAIAKRAGIPARDVTTLLKSFRVMEIHAARRNR
jgi:signal recognition particle GTPase